MNELLSGMELNEMGDGSAMHEIGGQIQEYQSKLSSLQHSYIQLFKNQFDTVSSLCKTYLKNQGKPGS